MPTSETAAKAVSTPEVAAGEEGATDPPTSNITGNTSPQLEYTEIETPNLSAVVGGQLSDITGLDIQSELEGLEETSTSENADLEVPISDPPPFTKGVSIINPNIANTAISSATLVKDVNVSDATLKNVILTNLSGKEPVVLTDAQLKNLQSLSKRTLTNSGGSGVVTKVIITKNPGTNQPQAMPSGSASGQSTYVFSSGGLQQGQQITLTPTKTLAAGSLLSPTKLVQGSPTTPVRQSLLTGNKITISPGKSPAKLTMIPISGKSPQKIAPAPGQVITMVSKSLLSGTQVPLTTLTKPTSVAVSPSKLIIQKQPVVKQVLAQQVSVASKSGVPVSNVQPLSVAGSKFQYVRLVAASSTQANMQGRPLAPAIMTTAGQQQMRITVPVGQNVVSKIQTTGTNQRLLLPAAPVSTPITIRPALPQIRPAPRCSTMTQLPPGTTIISSGQNVAGIQRFALVPTQYVTQLQSISPASTARQESGYVPIASTSPAAESSAPSSSSKSNVNGASLGGSSSQRPRKPCNCTKSQCLKLYCDCFANGEFCHNCNCNNCFNNLDHEEERGRAIKSCLDRNPQAFHPKIGKQGPGNRRHNKGCNCKRSGCLKNYCECYEAKILCSALCKCVGCKNFEESPDRKTLMHLADAAEVRVQQQTAAKSKLSSQISDLPIRGPGSHGERLPYTFVTKEVVEATCNCLLAQAEQCERKRQLEVDEERMILEEFGRCLLQVIASANKTKDETSQ